MSTGFFNQYKLLRDLRNDAIGHPFSLNDPIGPSCAFAGFTTVVTVPQVNLTCVQYVGAFKFDSLMHFANAHETCHMTLARDQFETGSDSRNRSEAIVRADTSALIAEITYGPGGLEQVNAAMGAASIAIDVDNPNFFAFWSPTPLNSAWYVRTYQPKGIIASSCTP